MSINGQHIIKVVAIYSRQRFTRVLSMFRTDDGRGYVFEFRNGSGVFLPLLLCDFENGLENKLLSYSLLVSHEKI